MNDIDKWCAEQCGVHIQDTFGVPSGWFIPPDMLNVGDWTIQDPRCREIVREFYHLETIRDGHKWLCNAWSWGKLLGTGRGKTIAEAEIACITAIWEARNE